MGQSESELFRLWFNGRGRGLSLRSVRRPLIDWSTHGARLSSGRPIFPPHYSRAQNPSTTHNEGTRHHILMFCILGTFYFKNDALSSFRKSSEIRNVFLPQNQNQVPQRLRYTTDCVTEFDITSETYTRRSGVGTLVAWSFAVETFGEVDAGET